MYRIAATSILILALSACGGAGTALPNANAPTNTIGQSALGSIALTISIPHASATTATARTPAYVSPATQSVSVSPAGASAQLFVVTPSSPHCTNSSAVLTCTLSATASIGQNKSVVIATFATVDGTGTALSIGTVVTNVVAGRANPVMVTLNGVVAAVSVVLTPGTVTKGTAATVGLIVNALDVSGNTIIAPGVYVDKNGNPVTITIVDVDASQSTTTSQTTVTQTTSGMTLGYNGSNSFSTASISATASTGANGSANLTSN